MAARPSVPSRRTLPVFLASGAVLMLAALIAGDRLGRVGEAVFAVAAVLYPVLLIALGTRRMRSRLRGVLIALAAVLVLTALGIVLPELVAPPGSILFGLPPTAWLALGGLGLLPFVLVLWSYVATFDPRPARVRPSGEPRDGGHD